MDDPGSASIPVLVSRLAEALTGILQYPDLHEDFRHELQGLSVRLAMLQQSSFDPEVMRVLWPEVENELLSFVHGSSASGLASYPLRDAVDFLAGRSVMYFSTPPTSDLDLRRAVAGV